MNFKDTILELRARGYSYKQIKEATGCSKAVISYHCGVGQKEKTRARAKRSRMKRGERKQNKVLIGGIIASLLKHKK